MLNAMLALPFWEGHVVESCCEQVDGSLLIKLSELPEVAARCGACQEPCALVHERRRRRVRERDCFDRRVWLDEPIRRMDCHHCGARVVEQIGWLDRRSRITHRAPANVRPLCSGRRSALEALVSLGPGEPTRPSLIKRIAYGFRDSAYSFLKIKAAFPGKAR